MSPNSILITGASSGIGQALASYYAKPNVKLFLWGRSAEKLSITAETCRKKGSEVFSFIADLTNPVASCEQLQDLLQKNRIDLAILAAGSGDIKKDNEVLESPKTILELAQLNYVTPSMMANLLANDMIKKTIRGHIVFVSSVAGFHSLPFATAYSSSKAGLSRFSDSLRLALKKYKIQVTLIVPGFIDTPMSQRLECDKPFLLPLDNAASQISRAIELKKKELILPKIFVFLKWIDILAPNILRDFILLRIKVKQD